MIREFHQTSLRGRNSFGVEQHAARLAEFETEEDLHAIFGGGIPDRWSVLSGGNNILFTQDYDGLLLTPVSQRIALLSEEGGTVHVRADAGVEWDDLVEWAVQHGLWGLENLSLIPGKAGAAPVQNIGAYGCEAKDAIERVHMFCVENCKCMTLDAAHCCFGYRESIFKHDLRGRVVITAVDIRLSRTPQPRLGYGDVEREVEARGGTTLRNIRAAQCGELFQKPGRRRIRGATIAGQLARHAALPRRPFGQGQTRRRVAHRQGGAERLPKRTGRHP